PVERTLPRTDPPIPLTSRPRPVVPALRVRLAAVARVAEALQVRPVEGGAALPDRGDVVDLGGGGGPGGLEAGPAEGLLGDHLGPQATPPGGPVEGVGPVGVATPRAVILPVRLSAPLLDLR